MFKCQSAEVLIANWERENNYRSGGTTVATIDLCIKLPKITINLNMNNSETKSEMIKAMTRL